MTYKEAIDYIHSVTWKGSRPGLSRITELCASLGNTQDELSFVHVASTNGKGSFCCMLASVLAEAGYTVGLFTSPFVKSFNERFRVNGKSITDEELAEVTEHVKPHADKMDDLPTEFELITAIAFEYFRRRGCDIVVLEVGMGGRLDSTNIIKTPILSVITEISLDHTSFLGSTVEEIAREKAGIIKPSVPVLFAGTDEAAADTVAAAAHEAHAAFTRIDYSSLFARPMGVYGSTFNFDGGEGYRVALAGEYQPRNAAAVITAVRLLRLRGMRISDAALRAGLAKARWQARFELLSEEPMIVYDGGHNVGGVTAAFKSVRECYDEPPILLSGVMADKEYREVARIASEYACRVYTVTPNVPRALDAEAYAEVYRSLGVEAVACESVEAGVAEAIADAKKNHRDLFIFGSLYMYADVESAVMSALYGREVK